MAPMDLISSCGAVPRAISLTVLITIFQTDRIDLYHVYANKLLDVRIPVFVTLLRVHWPYAYIIFLLPSIACDSPGMHTAVSALQSVSLQRANASRVPGSTGHTTRRAST